MALTEAERAESRARKEAARAARAAAEPSYGARGPDPFDAPPEGSFPGVEIAAPRTRLGGDPSPSNLSSSTSTVESEPAPSFDYTGNTRALFPGLPQELIDVLANEWADTGNIDLATAAMRSHATYPIYFPGNLREDGSVRFREQDYFAQRDSYLKVYTDFGLDPAKYQDRIGGMIEGDRSPLELRDSIQTRVDYINQTSDIVRDYARNRLGIEPGLPEMLDSLLSKTPVIPETEYRRRLQASFVGGTAAEFGFDRDPQRVQELMAAGLDTEAEARQLYSQTAQTQPGLDVAGRRYFEGGVDVGAFEQAAVFQDPREQERLRRIQARNRSAFTRAGSVATRDGRLTGLRPT